MRKPLYKVSFLFLIFNCSSISAKEYSGVWAPDCKSSNNAAATLLITRATSDGLYKVVHSSIKISKQTSIIGDKDFKIINDEKISYKFITYNRCVKSEAPKYSPLLEAQIQKFMQGEWKDKYQERSANKNNISHGKSGSSDLKFINEDYAKISQKNKLSSEFYEAEDGTILLKSDLDNPLKIHLMGEKESNVNFEIKPSSGVFINYKYGDMNP
jgi:hypothetical protein